MIFFPLATFYFLLYIVFDGNKDYLGWCGIGAVIAANCVIGSYVKMAWEEDESDGTEQTVSGIATRGGKGVAKVD